MSWNPALPADTSKIRLSAAFIRNNQNSLQTVMSASSLNGSLPYLPPTASATPAPVWMYLNAAPPGWTLVAAVADTLLSVKGGPIYTTGGVVTGAWTSGGYALQPNDIPNILAAGPFGRYTVNFGAQAQVPSQHIHDWNNPPVSRPMGAVGILVTKDA